MSTPSPTPPSAVGALVRFARLVAAEQAPDQVLRVLVDRAVEDVGADAAGAFCVTADGDVRLLASRGLPVVAQGIEVDAIGPELGAAVQRACGERFAGLHVLSLISGGDLFGALLLAVEGAPLDAPRLELAQGLADLAAVAQRTAAQLEDLRRTNADLRTAREALSRAEKLSALGHMATGIAHDLSNVLGPLVGDVENLRAREQDERSTKALARMARYLTVGRDLCDRLRRFARQAPEAGHVALDPTGALRDAHDLCAARGREARPPVEVRLELAEALRPIVVSTSDLTSALVNLIVNGIEAQPGGGRVVLRAGAGAGGVWIEVQDAGPGIPEERRARVFEPFFTTKGERGTGLGLANVYSFVQRHRGAIGFRCPAGGGTTFRMEFPPS